MLALDLIDTLAFGGVVLLLGYALRHYLPVLERYNLPAPVVGGLVIAIAITLAHSRGITLVAFDTTLQTPLMVAFFTTIGFGASVALLRRGGALVLRFLLLATAFAVLQNVVGAGVAVALGLEPLFGVLVGSVTLTGGPATGLAFAPLFEQAGVQGAAAVAVAAAMGGIVAGGVIGGPICTWLIRRYRLAGQPQQTARRRGAGDRAAPDVPAGAVAFAGAPLGPAAASAAHAPAAGRIDAALGAGDPDPDVEALTALKNLVAVLVAMWLGGWVSDGFVALGWTLPAYVGAMLVAAAIRNVDDATGWFGLSQRFIGELGAVTLSLFLVIALMTLRLWELAGLAVPLLTILAVQIVLTALVCAWPVYQVLGRDYESAVMTGGFVGFMLGTTANAMAVMRTLAERYGAAPTAFLVAPLVGAFFIDFTNALIITAFLNLLG